MKIKTPSAISGGEILKQAGGSPKATIYQAKQPERLPPVSFRNQHRSTTHFQPVPNLCARLV